MRAVVQRVSSSKVTVDENTIGSVKKGLLVLLGVTHEDRAIWLILSFISLNIA